MDYQYELSIGIPSVSRGSPRVFLGADIYSPATALKTLRFLKKSLPTGFEVWCYKRSPRDTANCHEVHESDLEKDIASRKQLS